MSFQFIKHRTLINIFAILLLLCIGLYFVPFSIMGSNLEFIPGDVGDAGLTYYTLEHGFQWLSGDQESFWSAPFFYPEPMVITFAEHLLGAIPIYSVMRLLGLDRETSFQWWMIIIFILNYVACIWSLRKFSISWLGAAAGAYIFTFSLPVISRLHQTNVLIRFMVPLAFYFTWRYLNKPTFISLIGLCLSLVFQFYCSIHIGIFLFLSIAVFIISSAVLNRKQYNWHEILWDSQSKFACRMSIIIASCLTLIPLLFPYYYSSLEVGVHSWSKISNMLPRIQSLIAPNYGSLLWHWLEPLNNNLPGLQHSFFIGMIPWLSVAIVLLWRLKININAETEIGRTAALSVLLIVLITLYWNGFSFYKYISIIPGFKAIHEVTRIILVLSFLFAISVGVLFTRLEYHGNKKTYAMLSGLFSFLLLGILVADQYILPNTQQRYPKSAHQSASQNLADRVLMKNPSATVFAYMPSSYTGMPQIFHMHAMLASQSIHVPTINGYSSRWPQGYDFFLNYNKVWALKKWILFARPKYSANPDLPENLFDGLVIVGGLEDNVDELENDLNNLTISIADGPLPDEGFKADIFPDIKNLKVKNSLTVLPVKVTNNSAVIWPALGASDGTNQIRLSYRWLSLDEVKIEGYDNRFPLHYDLLPGESITLEVEMKFPEIPGRYIAEFDMLQEHVSWFANKGSKTARIETDTREPAVNRDYIMLNDAEYFFYPWEIHNGIIPGILNDIPRFRWSQKRSSMSLEEFLYNNSKRELFLLCSNPDIMEAPVKVTLLIDDTEIKEVSFNNHEWRKVSLKSVSFENKKNLTFQVSRTWSPKAFGLSGDDRELGVAVALPNSE